MSKIVVLDNLFLQMNLNNLRDKETISTSFRSNLRNAGFHMTYEIIGREAVYNRIKVKTVLGTADGIRIKDKILQIMVMRAGEPFTEGGAQLLDGYNCNRNIGVIDAKRIEKDNTFEMDVDMSSIKVPDFDKETIVIIYDPMLATGSTMDIIFSKLKARGKAKKWILCSIIATPFGAERLSKKFHDIIIYTLAIDKQKHKGLNSKGYIVPGLGDCGDRAFGNY